MNTLFEQYMNLNIDAVWIGLEKRDEMRYSCTPIGAKIFGWDCGGLHYCFIDGFGACLPAACTNNSRLRWRTLLGRKKDGAPCAARLAVTRYRSKM